MPRSMPLDSPGSTGFIALVMCPLHNQFNPKKSALTESLCEPGNQMKYYPEYIVIARCSDSLVTCFCFCFFFARYPFQVFVGVFNYCQIFQRETVHRGLGDCKIY